MSAIRSRYGLGGLGQAPPGTVDFYDMGPGNPKDVPACLAKPDFKPYFNNTQCCVRAADGRYRCQPISVSAAPSGTPATGKQNESFCLRTVQQYLFNKGLLAYQYIDGKWNSATSGVLSQQLGAGWDKIPGGPCALVGVLDARYGAASTFGSGIPGVPGQYPGGMYPNTGSFSSMFAGTNTTTLLLFGVGALALVMLARR